MADPAPEPAGLTPQRRLGHWEVMPDDSLLVLLAMTVPGGTIRSALAAAMAARLRETRALLIGTDDGRYGLTAIAPFTQAMEAGLDAIGPGGVGVCVTGGYEPTGWWDAVPAEAGHAPVRHDKGIIDVPDERGLVDGTLTEFGDDPVRVDGFPFLSSTVKFGSLLPLAVPPHAQAGTEHLVARLVDPPHERRASR